MKLKFLEWVIFLCVIWSTKRIFMLQAKIYQDFYQPEPVFTIFRPQLKFLTQDFRIYDFVNEKISKVNDCIILINRISPIDQGLQLFFINWIQSLLNELIDGIVLLVLEEFITNFFHVFFNVLLSNFWVKFLAFLLDCIHAKGMGCPFNN